MIEHNPHLLRDAWMNFFHHEDFHEHVTPDDCVEVFRGILVGSSDITKELLDGVISDYSAGLIVIDPENPSSLTSEERAALVDVLLNPNPHP
jgi:hypothetical protein